MGFFLFFWLDGNCCNMIHFIFFALFNIWSQTRFKGEALGYNFGKHASQDLCIHLSSIQTVELLDKPKYFHELEPRKGSNISWFPLKLKQLSSFQSHNHSNPGKYICFQKVHHRKKAQHLHWGHILSCRTSALLQ